MYSQIIQIVEATNMFYRQEWEGLQLFSYHYINPEIYKHAPLAREIRGIVFDKNGNIVLRPFPKFFNYGEPACGVKEDDLAISNEKLDGSLVSTSFYKDKIVVASKGSLKSWVVEKANVLIEVKQELQHLIKDFKGYTVMFELLDPEHPIVIPPKHPELVLIGIRHNRTGKLLNPLELEEVGKQYSVSYARIKYKDVTIRELNEIVKPLQGIEGVVAYTDSDICKIKTRWYLELHKVSTNINERKILKMYINNELDDIYGLLPNHIKQKVQDIIKKADDTIDSTVQAVRRFFEENIFESRKDLALYLQQSDIEKSLWKIYFDVYSGKDVKEAVFEYFKKKWSKA